MFVTNELKLPTSHPDDFIVYTGVDHPLYEEINLVLRLHRPISFEKADELFPIMEEDNICTDFLNNEHANAYYHGLYKLYKSYDIIMAIEYQHQKDEIQQIMAKVGRSSCKDRLVSRRSHQQRKRR